MNPPPQRGKPSNKRGARRWTPYNYNFVRHPKPTSVPISNHQNDSQVSSSTNSETSSVISITPSVSRSVEAFFLNGPPGQYSGWKLYFPEEPFDDESILVGKIKAFEEHITVSPNLYDLEKATNRRWYPLDIAEVIQDGSFLSKWPSFQKDLLENPEETLKCVGLAMHQRLVNFLQRTIIGQICARIQTNIKNVKFKSLKPIDYGKLFVVRGSVIRLGSCETRATWLTYRCSRCKAEQAIKQINRGTTTAPSSCCCNNRSSSSFIPILSSPFTLTEASRTIRLQEMVTRTVDKVPRTIEIELENDLVDLVSPGDDVTVIGILQVASQDNDNQVTEAACAYKMHLKAVSILSNRNASLAWKSSFSSKDSPLQTIAMIKSERCVFRLLVHSLSPNIYGHEMVKAGLVLGLLGGSNNLHRRSQCHVLIVGDPGVGKSQMLQDCAEASPKGIFVCGKTSSSIGLTATVHHEKGNNASWGAGALLIADQGTCCIDEFDKMPNNHTALLEVMEQQVVSIAKAGVFCSLPARTSVFAAANPSGGHYDKSRTVSENIKINPALLSRFDLVFIVLDRPDAHLDGVLSDHRNTLHNMSRTLSTSSTFQGNKSILSGSIGAPLNVRLQLKPNEIIDPLPLVLMQTYIAYARQNCNPKLSANAVNVLRAFYLELRSLQQGSDSIPVTTRQLEALVRMTQARARIDLSDEATEQHAHDVVTIVKYSMIDVMTDDVGTLQMERQINGSGMSQTTQIRKFVGILQARSRTLNKKIFSMSDLKDTATNAGLRFQSFPDAIESLNIQGYLLKKGSNVYKLLD